MLVEQLLVGVGSDQFTLQKENEESLFSVAYHLLKTSTSASAFENG
jgi:hypothetical protein